MSLSRTPAGRSLVHLLFFLSGATALVYEVVWSRQLTYVFGGSSLAVATVLAAYMAGLALGSYLFGRIADRVKRPFLLYGLLEGAIAVWALLLPFLFRLADPAYRALYEADAGPVPLTAARFALCFLMLLVPTTMMGGTLPILLRYVTLSMGRIGRTAALLYALNTLGAVSGTIAAGFVLLPALGLSRATMLAAALNLLILALAVWRGRAPIEPRAERSEPEAGPKAGASSERLRRAALVTYALSGFCALAYEVVWTRVLLMSLGTTTYAFTTMLASFLLGISLGSLVASRFVDRLRRPGVAFALTQIGIALTALAAVPVLGAMPRLFLKIYPLWGDSWLLQIAMKFGLALLAMLPTTILLGMTFPLVARIALTGLSDVGRRVGVLYAWNTVGAISGSLTAGFLLLPLLGRQPALLVVGLVNIAAGALLLAIATPTRRLAVRLLAPAAAVFATLFAVAARPWDVHLYNSGMYANAQRYRDTARLQEFLDSAVLLYEGEDSEAVISVWSQKGVLTLRTNGKVEASTSGDMATQKLIAHLPLLAHERPKAALLVGLASGITLGSMLTHPLEEVVTVELLPSMRPASDRFRLENRDALDDPRSRLVIEDGRNFLHLDPKRYDVIVSEPSNPWIAGLSNLFSREFFRLAASRLAPGGIMCQWVQIYDMRTENLNAVLRTFCDVFPHVTLWWAAPAGDLIMLGSEDATALDPNRLARRTWPEPVREDLASISIASNAGILANYIAGGRRLTGYLGTSGPRVTDDNLLLEFAVPRNFYRALDDNVLERIYAVREPVVVRVPEGSPDGRALDVVDSRYRAVVATSDPSTPNDETVRRLEALFAENPEDPLIRQKLAEALNEAGSSLLRSGDRERARALFARAVEIGVPSEQLIADGNLGLLSFEANDDVTAEEAWTRALRLNARNPDLHYNLGQLYYRRGDAARAESSYREALRWSGLAPGILNALAWLLAEQGKNPREAVQLAERAVAADPSANFLDTLGYARLRAGDVRGARRDLERAVAAAPSSAEIHYHLALARSESGDAGGARSSAERALELGPDETVAAGCAELLRSLGPAGGR